MNGPLISMQLVREYIKGKKILYMVATGNGGADFKALRELFSKFNGSNIICFPEPRGKRYSGLGALRIIRDYTSDYKINSSIFLVDGEHIRNDFENEIQAKLREFAITVDNIQQV
ncbi:MAG: hypothetical protein ACTSO9_01065 [Candidatus Helarchaeota archaeon]